MIETGSEKVHSDRLITVNDKPLTEQPWNQKNHRFDQLFNNRSQLKKAKRLHREEGEQAICRLDETFCDGRLRQKYVIWWHLASRSA